MRNACTKWTGIGAFRVHMDPLMVTRGVGKSIDALLGDGDPFSVAQICTYGCQHAGDRIEDVFGVRAPAHVQARCELTDTTSPVM